MKYSLLALTLSMVLFGCATTGTNGVVQIGQNMYMIGGLGKFTDFSGAAVEARLFQQATQYCQAKGEKSVPISSSSQDALPGVYASGNVKFSCVK
jgi:hypothetical protein